MWGIAAHAFYLFNQLNRTWWHDSWRAWHSAFMLFNQLKLTSGGHIDVGVLLMHLFVRPTKLRCTANM
jgi:TRAP-type mannitol/chloroaromatic compound transport system permease small subunit